MIANKNGNSFYITYCKVTGGSSVSIIFSRVAHLLGKGEFRPPAKILGEFAGEHAYTGNTHYTSNCKLYEIMKANINIQRNAKTKEEISF
jgi:hypothetical protein